MQETQTEMMTNRKSKDAGIKIEDILDAAGIVRLDTAIADMQRGNVFSCPDFTHLLAQLEAEENNDE